MAFLIMHFHPIGVLQQNRMLRPDPLVFKKLPFFKVGKELKERVDSPTSG